MCITHLFTIFPIALFVPVPRLCKSPLSGLKNEFADKPLHILERLNYYLYSNYSPLNWFTKRRGMKIKVRRPNVTEHKTIHNGSGLGLVKLSENLQQVDVSVLTNKEEVVTFEVYEETI